MTFVADLLRRRTTLRGPRLLLVALHIPIAALAPVYVILGVGGNISSSGPAWLAVPCGAMIFGLQLRHSLAAARGEHPRGGVWTLLALAVLAYAPLHWLHLNWLSAQWPLMVSVPMVFDGWLAAVILAGPGVYWVVEEIRIFLIQVVPAQPAAADYLYWISYDIAGTVIPPVALYAATRLVKVTDELRGTRAALAQAAVDTERLRISRDLHDLLGHSLSAISLKGDLAIRLLKRDTSDAVAEMDSLTTVARAALDDLRNITDNSGTISLQRELDNARALLANAGVALRVHGKASSIPSTTGEVMAWVVREGVTNIVRHATASTAVITLACHDGQARLEITNDGAPPAAQHDGHGLTGLANRIHEASGTLSHEWLRGGRFRLTAQIPRTPPEEPSWTASGCSSPKTST